MKALIGLLLIAAVAFAGVTALPVLFSGGARYHTVFGSAACTSKAIYFAKPPRYVSLQWYQATYPGIANDSPATKVFVQYSADTFGWPRTQDTIGLSFYGQPADSLDTLGAWPAVKPQFGPVSFGPPVTIWMRFIWVGAAGNSDSTLVHRVYLLNDDGE